MNLLIAFETTLLPDNVASNDERMLLTMKITVYSQIKGKISVKGRFSFVCVFFALSFSLPNKNLKSVLT